jgi:hypothetical protein
MLATGLCAKAPAPVFASSAPSALGVMTWILISAREDPLQSDAIVQRQIGLPVLMRLIAASVLKHGGGHEGIRGRGIVISQPKDLIRWDTALWNLGIAGADQVIVCGHLVDHQGDAFLSTDFPPNHSLTGQGLDQN